MADFSLNKPIFFEKNRVGRVYTGGALFADFFGDDSTDGFEPEEWIASYVTALNGENGKYKEGVSRVRGTDIFFDELLEQNKRDLLGNRDEFGVLTKILDSAIRLPIQAHPDKAFSQRYFNSNYGKAESWVVLSTRPGACIYFGFNRSISTDEFKKAVETSEYDKTAMDGLLNRIPVNAGDVFFVPAGMVHAIGYGCLILEIQEPTDFTIQPEYWCGDYRLSEREMYIGLPHDTALTAFDYTAFGEDAVAMGRKIPRRISDNDGVSVEELITYNDTPCFAVWRYTVNSSEVILTQKPAVYVVTEGSGMLVNGDESQKLVKGDYFFLPYCATETKLVSADKLSAVVCLPPK